MSILLSAPGKHTLCPPGVTFSPRPQSAEEMESGRTLCPPGICYRGRNRGIHTGPQGAAGGISQHCSPHSSLSEEGLERNFSKHLSHHQEKVAAFLPLQAWAALGGGGSLLFEKPLPHPGGPVVSQVQPVLGAHAAHLAWPLPQQGLPGLTSPLSLPAKHTHETRQGHSSPLDHPWTGFAEL